MSEKDNHKVMALRNDKQPTLGSENPAVFGGGFHVTYQGQKYNVGSFLIICLLLTGCKTLKAETTPTKKVEASATAVTTQPPTPSFTPQPTSTSAPSPTSSRAPSATPTPTEDVVAKTKQILEEMIASPAWETMGLSERHIAQWKTYAEGNGTLSKGEFQVLVDFATRWKKLNILLGQGTIPKKATPVFRVKEYSDEQGKESVIPYLIDEKTAGKPGAERLFLVVHPLPEKGKGLVLAPTIEGLKQQISPDGEFVEYINKKGELLINADARHLNKEDENEKTFKEVFDTQYSEDNYKTDSIYPRFYFLIPGVESSFFNLGSMTLNQILLLKSTFEIYDKPELAALKYYIFPKGDDVVFFLSREQTAHTAAAAIGLGGKPRKGIVILFTKNLFDNRYYTAGSLGHEAAHIWQGKPASCDNIPERRKREIGNKAVPFGLSHWTAAQLVSAVEMEQIGSYHVSLWIAYQLGIKEQIAWILYIIDTGVIDGVQIGACGQ